MDMANEFRFKDAGFDPRWVYNFLVNILFEKCFIIVLECAVVEIHYLLIFQRRRMNLYKWLWGLIDIPEVPGSIPGRSIHFLVNIFFVKCLIIVLECAVVEIHYLLIFQRRRIDVMRLAC